MGLLGMVSGLINRKLWKLIGYEPHDKQYEFHASNARFKVPVCGRRWGKSRGAAAEVEPLILGEKPTRGWIVGPEYKIGEKEFRYLWQDLIIELKLPKLGVVTKKAYNVRTGEMYIELKNGSRVDVMSADHPDSLVGEGLDWVIVSEAAKQSPHVWEKYLSPALADHHGVGIFPSCVVAGTRLITEDGLITIGELSDERTPGMYEPFERMVVGFAGPMEKATKFYCNGIAPTVKLTTDVGLELEGSFNHPVWVMGSDGRASWCEMQDLTLGDWVAVRRGADVWGDDDSIEAIDIKYDKGHIILPAKVDKDLGYLMGLILGDGYVSFEEGKRSITMTTADEQTERFLGTWGFRDQGEYHWTLGSKRLIEFLRWYGFKPRVKSPSKQVPDRLWRASREVVIAFLQGLFDADGSAVGRGRVTLTSSSQVLIKEVQFLLLNLGIKSIIRYHYNAPSKKVKVWSHRWVLELAGTEFFDVIGFRLGRKQAKRMQDDSGRATRMDGVPDQGKRIERVRQKCIKITGGKGYKRGDFSKGFDTLKNNKLVGYRKLREFLNLTEPLVWDDDDWQTLNAYANERYLWTKVSKLEEDEAEVFDLVVPTTHALVFNGVIGHNTPEGFNWYYEIYMDGQRERDGEWKSWRYPAWENPHVYPLGFEDPECQRQMRTEDDPWFWQELGADFRSIVGLIYPEWDATRHVRPITYNSQWDNFLGYDPAYTSPFAVLDIMVDGMENVYVWREWYEKGRTGYKAAQELKAREQPDGYHINYAFGDSAAPEVIEDFGLTLAPTMAESDAKDIAAGIQEVKKLLAPSADEPPRLFVDPSCVNFIREIEGYKIKSPPRGRDPRDNIKDEPLKRDDHAMDALRYFAMHRFKLNYAVHIDQSYIVGDEVGDDMMGVGETIFNLDRVIA